MELQWCIGQMADHAEMIRKMVLNISPEQARWKPDEKSWSILEVINHLYDEEREDFRVRLDLVLRQKGESWPPIDPPGWVTARAYNQRELSQSMQNFLQERKKPCFGCRV